MSVLFSTLARLLQSVYTIQQETSTINVTKPYKRRLRLKQDPISVMRRRLYKLTTRDPKISRQRKLTRKVYNRKNKSLLERRADFVKKYKERLPDLPGKVNPKRKSGN